MEEINNEKEDIVQKNSSEKKNLIENYTREKQ